MFAKCAFVLWFVGCMTGILVMSVTQLADFDPDLKLSLAISDLGFEQELVSQIQYKYQVSDKTLVHFSQDNCFCNTLSQSHIQTFSSQMQNQGFNNIYINLNQYPEFAKFIPSIPAVAVIGAVKELIYLGPYSEGYGCLQGTGLVDSIIPRVTNQRFDNALLVTEAKGCYCQT